MKNILRHSYEEFQSLVQNLHMNNYLGCSVLLSFIIYQKTLTQILFKMSNTHFFLFVYVLSVSSKAILIFIRLNSEYVPAKFKVVCISFTIDLRVNQIGRYLKTYRMGLPLIL